MNIVCPSCQTPLVKEFDGPPGAKAQGYCGKCKLEVTVKRRVPATIYTQTHLTTILR